MTSFVPLPGKPEAKGGSTAGWSALWPAFHGVDLLADLSGGCVLALVVIAQGLAAASVARVSLTAGIYSGILPPLVYGVFGSSRHLSVGGGAMVSMVVAEQVATLESIESRTKMASALALVAGIVMCSVGVSGLAFLVRFISRPALSGLISASGLMLICSQRQQVLGLAGAPSGLHEKKAFLSQVNPGTSLLSGILLALVLGLQCFKGRSGVLGRIAAVKELVAMVVGTVLAMSAAWVPWLADRPITLLGDVPAGLPEFTWPLAASGPWGSLNEMSTLLPGAMAIAVTSFVTSFAGAKTVALQQGYEISATRELLALGLSSSLGGCTGGVPILGSLNRTALAATMVRTQVGAGIVVALVVAFSVKFMSQALQVLPLCVVATLIVASSIPLVNYKEFVRLYRMRHCWTERGDLLIWVISFFVTLTRGIFIGISAAVVLSLALLIYEVAQPVVQELGRTSEGLWIRSTNKSAKGQPVPGTLVLRVDGPIFFANAEYVQDRILQLVRATETVRDGDEAPLRRIILEASKVTFLDATSMQVLEETAQSLRARGVTFSIVEAPARTHEALQHNLPHLHPHAERGFRVTVNEVLGLPPANLSNDSLQSP
mmetsp:Transcript_106249/g.310621  ORF Transcript_106249/g.310621 Transcript_106249/m.310621 type:complete len:603 (-) Transcript_106249:109-1917(-)